MLEMCEHAHDKVYLFVEHDSNRNRWALLYNERFTCAIVISQNASY